MGDVASLNQFFSGKSRVEEGMIDHPGNLLVGVLFPFHNPRNLYGCGRVSKRGLYSSLELKRYQSCRFVRHGRSFGEDN